MYSFLLDYHLAKWKVSHLKYCSIYLPLNINKTKDKVIDFRRSKPSPLMTTIKGRHFDIADTHKYLGVVIYNKLSFQLNLLAICKRVQQRLFILRKLKSFRVCPTMTIQFYKCIESVLICIVAWYGILSETNKRWQGQLLVQIRLVLYMCVCVCVCGYLTVLALMRVDLLSTQN